MWNKLLMKLFNIVVVLFVISCTLVFSNPVHAVNKIEIINLSGSPTIDADNNIGAVTFTARLIEGATLTNKQSRRLTRNGLNVRVRAPKQSGVKLTPSPNRVNLVFNPLTETFSTATVFYIPTQVNQ